MTVNPLFVTLLQSAFVGTILDKTSHVFITLLLHPHSKPSSYSLPSPDNIYFGFWVLNYGVRGLNEKGETEIFQDAPKDGIVKIQKALAYQTETDNRNSENPNILENMVWPEIIEN